MRLTFDFNRRRGSLGLDGGCCIDPYAVSMSVIDSGVSFEVSELDRSVAVSSSGLLLCDLGCESCM